MVVLGIDPGIATVGFGIIRADGPRHTFIRCGVISTPAGQHLSTRLARIFDDTLELIDTFKPDAISIEELFFNTNLKTGISVAHGRGVVLLAGEKRGIPMYEYTPLQVKQAICGYGRADKRQMMEMVKNLLKLEQIVRPDDASDALALAMCHARNTNSLLNVKGGNDPACSTI